MYEKGLSLCFPLNCLKKSSSWLDLLPVYEELGLLSLSFSGSFCFAKYFRSISSSLTFPASGPMLMWASAFSSASSFIKPNSIQWRHQSSNFSLYSAGNLIKDISYKTRIIFRFSLLMNSQNSSGEWFR
eukprot:TRINITY_DN17577_c0_g1_i2.p1 TRINITY_DN17577_c0_g1~~TRINITY_DN17577_c0_g1_i2.p1  ORF type:complete len:129 (+),score=4.51 TRINITY_DN17577_c0_g1_i2:418-804(+)